MWDERYSEPGFAFGTAPNDFLVAQVHRFPEGGRVICLAEGEGRNAVFLARQGFEVLAVDQSPVGLDKARALAREQGVTLETRVADLNHFSLEPGDWDAIVSIYAHVPPETRKRLHAETIHALRPGGILLLEAYTRRQLDMPGVGGPPAHMAELFMAAEALREELDGLHLLHLSELEREVNEGAYHTGLGAVVQVIGQKG